MARPKMSEEKKRAGERMMLLACILIAVMVVLVCYVKKQPPTTEAPPSHGPPPAPDQVTQMLVTPAPGSDLDHLEQMLRETRSNQGPRYDTMVDLWVRWRPDPTRAEPHADAQRLVESTVAIETKKRRWERMDEDEDQLQEEEEVLDATQLAAKLDEAMAQLDDATLLKLWRDARPFTLLTVVLTEWSPATHEEIAAEIGESANTVSQRATRNRAELRSLAPQDYWRNSSKGPKGSKRGRSRRG